jgi:hypothetical protein
MSIRTRLLVALTALAAGIAAVVVVALLAAPIARADGDPASDYLLGQSTFIPFDDGIPKAYAAQLANTVAEAKARGYAIRVALIGTRYDLGSVTVLYNQPKRYARFLGQELFFVYKGRLLVVMPKGLAVSKAGKPLPAEQAVVDRIPAPGPGGAALAAAATQAVARLAANAGVVFPLPKLGPSGGSSTNRDRLEIAGIALVVVLILAAVSIVRRRRRRPV